MHLLAKATFVVLWASRKEKEFYKGTCSKTLSLMILN